MLANKSRAYNREFKLKAVQLGQTSGKGMAEIRIWASARAVSGSGEGNWRAAAGRPGGQAGHCRSSIAVSPPVGRSDMLAQ